jgi:hypothetical protein
MKPADAADAALAPAACLAAQLSRIEPQKCVSGNMERDGQNGVACVLATRKLKSRISPSLYTFTVEPK